MAKVLVSHRGADAKKAERLAKKLQAAGHQVWLDAWEIGTGMSIPGSINIGLGNANYVVVCLSALGLAPWMSAEVWSTYARQLNGQSIKLLPVRFRNGRTPPLLADLRAADLTKNWNDGVAELLRAIR